MIHLLRHMLALLAMTLTLWPDPGAAQQEVTVTDRATAMSEVVRLAGEHGLTVMIVDPEGRRAAPAGETETETAHDAMAGMSALMKTQASVLAFRETLHERLDALPNSLNEVAYILRATSPDGRIMTYAEVLLWTSLLLAIGHLAAIHIYGKRLVRSFVVGRVLAAPRGYRQKMPFLTFRFFMGLTATLFAMAVAYGLGTLGTVAGLFEPVDDISVQFTIAAIYIGFAAGRTLADVWRMMLSPFLSQYRIPAFSDTDARRLFYWAVILGGFHIFVALMATWIRDFGLNYNVYAILYGLLDLVAALGDIAMIAFNAAAVSAAIRGGRAREDCALLVRAVSVAWAPLMVAYIAFGWLNLAFDLVMETPPRLPLVVGAYLVILSMVVVYGLINYLIERWFDRRIAVSRLNDDMAAADASEDGPQGTEEEEERGGAAPLLAYRPAITTFEQLARRVAGILAFVAGAFALLRIWDPENAVLEDSFLGRSMDIVTILFIGYVVYHFFRIWIDSRIAEEAPAPGEVELGDEGGAGGASRLATLLPLFRGAILAVVVVAIGLIVLLEIGINVSPLFAGAGVVGLAVGFGAQTLVRDIFSGAFFLVDDAFRKGEYIDIESVKGTVEKISLRSFQLRHHLGALHTIPFGEIKVLTNYSRDWVMMKLPLRVTYDTDVEAVRKLIKKLGQELLDDPVIGESFIQPLKSQGVIDMQDSAMIVRVKFMTKPGDQWLVRKRVYEEIRALFAREGIRFAHREVTVRLAEEKIDDLSEAQKHALAGAVQSVIEGEEMAEGPGGTSGNDR